MNSLESLQEFHLPPYPAEPSRDSGPLIIAAAKILSPLLPDLDQGPIARGKKYCAAACRFSAPNRPSTQVPTQFWEAFDFLISWLTGLPETRE